MFGLEISNDIWQRSQSGLHGSGSGGHVLNHVPERAGNGFGAPMMVFLGGPIARHLDNMDACKSFVVQVLAEELREEPFIEGFRLRGWNRDRWKDGRWHGG